MKRTCASVEDLNVPLFIVIDCLLHVSIWELGLIRCVDNAVSTYRVNFA
jgi:hypothetical protein